MNQFSSNGSGHVFARKDDGSTVVFAHCRTAADAKRVAGALNTEDAYRAEHKRITTVAADIVDAQRELLKRAADELAKRLADPVCKISFEHDCVPERDEQHWTNCKAWPCETVRLVRLLRAAAGACEDACNAAPGPNGGRIVCGRTGELCEGNCLQKSLCWVPQ